MTGTNARSFAAIIDYMYFKMEPISEKNYIYHFRVLNFQFYKYLYLSHNTPCFQYNTAIKNYLASHTCEIRFYNVRG